MSASAILSIVTAAAPLAGSGAATADTGTGADFEAILATETATIVTPAPSAPTLKPVVAERVAAEPSNDDPIILDATTGPTDVLATAPVWFQVASVGLPPTLPVVPRQSEDGITISTPFTASVPAESIVVTSQDASADHAIDPGADGAPVETPSNNPLPQTGSPQASLTTDALSADPTTVVTSAPGRDAAPVIDKAAPQAAVAQPTRSAENAALTQAAVASLRQLPGASTLQQATVSQRKTSGTATVPSDPVKTPTPVTTDTSPEADVTLPATVSATIPTRGIDTANAAAASRLATADPTVPLETSRTTHDTKVTGLATAQTIGLANDATFIAKRVIAADPQLPALDAIAEAFVDPEAQATPTASPVQPSSTAATPGIASASLSSLSRATIETTANLAAQITSRLAGKSTRFELGLTPEGLGRVDVTLDIDNDGQLSARLAFDNPLAATELRGRADELRRQLEDAGFTVARDALDFSSRDNPSGGERRQQRTTAYADRHAASDDLADLPPAWTVSPSRLTPQGVDVKV